MDKELKYYFYSGQMSIIDKGSAAISGVISVEKSSDPVSVFNGLIVSLLPKEISEEQLLDYEIHIEKFEAIT